MKLNKKAITLLVLTTLLMTLVPLVPMASAAEHGSPVDRYSSTDQFEATFATITLALANATDGDIIEVSNVYSVVEDIHIIVNNIELRTETGDTVILKGLTSGTAPIVGPMGILINAYNVSIHGFTIQTATNTASLPYVAMVHVHGAGAEIYDNTFAIASAYTVGEVVAIVSTQTVDVSGLNIHDNTFTATGVTPEWLEGIYINDNAATSGTVTIEDNTFNGYLIRAIATEQDKTTVTGNTMTTTRTASLRGGIEIQHAGSGSDTISTIVVEGNTIENFGTGVHIREAGTDQTSVNGISITENTFDTNAVGLQVDNLVAGVATIVVTQNDFIDNTMGVTNTDAETLNATLNYWGDPTGPGGVGTGLGDNISASVLYVPWLDATFDVGEPVKQVMLNSEFYSTGSIVSVTLTYGKANKDPIRTEKASVKAKSTSDPIGITVKLTETGANTGIFEGSFPIVALDPEPGLDELGVDVTDTITVTYLTYDATAIVDDVSPIVETVIVPLKIVGTVSTEVIVTITELNIDTVLVNGVAAIGTYPTYTATLIDLDYGNNTITAIATDMGGLTGTSSTWIVSDTIGPVVTTDPLVTPSKAMAGRDTYLSVNFTDDWSLIESVLVNLTDIGEAEDQAMAYNPISELWEYTATVGLLIEDGVYYLNITATDDTIPGNENVEFFVFEVITDTVPPVMGEWTVDYPTGKTSARELDVVNVTIVATDLPAGVNYVEINGTEITESDELVTMTRIGTTDSYYSELNVTSDLLDGTYYLNITATDYAGNTASTLVEVLIQEYATMDMYTVSTDYDPGDTVEFYVSASFAFDLDIGISDPNGFLYITIECDAEDHWMRIGDYSIVPYQAFFKLPINAVSGTWTWTALEDTKELANGDFAVGVTYTGTLSISTTPVDGEVFVNEESWGTVPAPREVEVGTYTVTFGDMLGYTAPSAEEAIVLVDALFEVEGLYVLIPVVPQLVITYTPDTVYANDEVTVTVEAEEAPIADADVWIFDPSGETLLFKVTDDLGTCTFTADEAGEWWISASKTDYIDAESVAITVIELAPVTDISLSVGWNLVSLPLIPTDSDVEVVLADILDDVESVWSYDAGTWYSYSPGAPSDLTDMVDGEGYWISMTASATLTVSGTEMPVNPFDPLPAYPVVEGYNLMGFKSTTPMTVSEYLLGVEYVRIYEYVDGYHMLTASDNMMPGRGYWIAVSEPGTIYP